MQKKVAVMIGGGRITRIILGGWARQGFDPEVHVFDPQPGALDRVKAEYPQVVIHRDWGTLPRADLVILGVHPPVLAEVITGIKGTFDPETLVVSLAPKVRWPQVKALLGGHNLVARMNPTAPSLVGQAFNPWSAGAAEFDTKLQIREKMEAWFSSLGTLAEVEDNQLEAHAVINAMGPTYLLFQLKVLADLGREFGLDETQSRSLVARMVQGSAALAADQNLPWDLITDLVPVKPLADHEPVMTGFYQDKLRGIFQKLTQ